MLTRRRKKMNAGDPIQEEDNENNETKIKKPRKDVKVKSSRKQSSSPSTVTTTSDLMERMSLSNESAKSKPGSPLGTPPPLDFEGHESDEKPVEDHEETSECFPDAFNFLQSSEDTAPVLTPICSPSYLSRSACSTPPPTLELPPSRETVSSPDESISPDSSIEPKISLVGRSRRKPPQLLPFALSYAGSTQNTSSSDDERDPKSFDSTSRNSWKVLADFGKNIAKSVSSKITRGSSEPNRKKGRRLKPFRGRNAKKMEELRQKDLEEKNVREGRMPFLEYHCERLKRKHFMLGLTTNDIEDIRSTLVDMMQKVVDLPPVPEKKIQQRSKKVFRSTRNFFLRSHGSVVKQEAVAYETKRE